MSYTIKPSVGMLPINDLDKVMEAQGFIKEMTTKDITELTKEIDPVTGAVKTPGITAPSQIAVSAGRRNPNGTLDRETVKNSLQLGGKNASEYLDTTSKYQINGTIDKVNSIHSDEIQLLRDELYGLKSELIKTGHVSDTLVANGLIEGFKKGNIKYDSSVTEVEAVNGMSIKQTTKIVSEDEWIAIKKDKVDVSTYALSTVVQENGNDIQIQIGSAGITPDKSLLTKTLGEYNKGTFSFSGVSYGAPGAKENYTMLNDDSNVVKHKIDSNYTGFATVIKMPTRSAGFLTKFAINGKAVGNPGSLVCYVIEGGQEYIDRIAKGEGLEQARLDGKLIAKSSPVRTIQGSDEIVFDFTRLEYDTEDPTSTLYPEVSGIEYCFVIEADNVTNYDFWQLEFGHKKSSPSDLQTNNKTYKFYNKGLVTTSANAFVEMAEIDMLYMATTRPKLEESEVPYSVGLYSSLNKITVPTSMLATRARLTLEVNKEGSFITTTQGAIRPEMDSIEFKKHDGTYAEQTVIGGGDKLIIGSNVLDVKTSTPGSVTVAQGIYVNPLTPIYRCGYEAQLKTYTVIDSPAEGEFIQPGTEKFHKLELVGVIPNGRGAQSSISDRLLFEVDINKDGTSETFNRAELQIKWKSFLSPGILQDQAMKSNDYIGRIHSMNLSFDRIAQIELTAVPQ